MKNFISCVIILWSCINYVNGFEQDPRKEFYHYTSVTPTVYSTTERKDVLTVQDLNEDEVNVEFAAFGKRFALNLRMNRNLLPKTYFEKYQRNGNDTILRPMEKKDGKHCHYLGHSKSSNATWAAISLCNGVSGVIYDEKEMYYIEPNYKSDNNTHFVFKRSDMKPRNARCGVTSERDHVERNQDMDQWIRGLQSVDLKIPYTNDDEPLVVEVLFVISKSEYSKYGSGVTTRSQQMANLINAVYVPLNIIVALIGIVIWDRRDEIDVTSDSDQIINSFLEYRKNRLLKEHPNDNAMLFIGNAFADEGVVGKALVGPICRDEFSGEIIADIRDVVAETAMTAAHELGHNFGMNHDGKKCKCSSETGKCIMHPSAITPPPTIWSDCSIKNLKKNLKGGAGYCMKNKPTYVKGPICGNGFVEEGEQCDCGPAELCKNRCCNAATCRLAASAVCATGRCCDLTTCQMKRAGTRCRSEISNCDLPEFCDGSSEFCPENVYKRNGMKCGPNEEGYCYQGKCGLHEEQCKLLWGSPGKNADLRCYAENIKGDRNFNCGVIDKEAKIYKPCESQDTLCGRLQCAETKTELQFGEYIDFSTWEGAIVIDRSWYKCQTAIVNLGPNTPDPGLVPDGAKCGDGKACLNQKCIPLSRFESPACPSNCNGKGVCNSKGHCHCERGFAPPDCANRGNGGSIDSGPVS